MPATVLAAAAKISEVSAKAIEKVAEIKEVAINEIKEGSVILQPDIESIKSKSLESIVASNIEKEVATETPAMELQPLSEEMKEKLREEGLLSERVIEAIRVDADGNYVLNCRNSELAGKTHPDTGVPFVEKTVQVGSIELRVVMPEFPTKFALDIPKEVWAKGDTAIFEYCTEQLKEAITANPELAKQFTSQQLEQIMNGDAYIKGLTWHHNEVPGRMELVDSKVHAATGHTGGNTIWCGGIR
jgi:hypothetical protein